MVDVLIGQVLPQGKILANEKLRRNCRWAESVFRFILGRLSALQVPEEGNTGVLERCTSGRGWMIDKWAWLSDRQVGVVG
ncbi:hypothetical protein ElyMa_003504400 [Elysia marginata]|uniref:Uncharacterized protein n=1 Tax=Elysia marginata TaxID=1093978 RepID=A0AAV4EFI1_9GAST|nr:hypothetical protein ElyMa_003504400 [Elysia marginata]